MGSREMRKAAESFVSDAVRVLIVAAWAGDVLLRVLLSFSR